MSQQEEIIRLHGPVQLASSEIECWKCHRQTPVHALLAADVEEFAPGEEPMRIEELPHHAHGSSEPPTPITA
ncbi:MAG: hypothetical protein ACK4PH_23765 [Aquincola tertiaricarbonis]